MDTKAQILSLLDREGPITSTRIGNVLKISRQALHRHLQKLIQEGQVAKQGITKGATYSLLSPKGLIQILHFKKRAPFPPEDQIFKEKVDFISNELSKEPQDIFYYAFTEMMNNAIDHASASQVDVRLFEGNSILAFEIVDDGIGCFEHIKKEKKLTDEREALEELSKGKLTTDEKRHTGEGIFFTSKTAISFTLESNGLKWTLDRVRDDMSVGPSEQKKGTRVEVCLDKFEKMTLESLFRQYTNQNFQFSKSKIYVRLFERGESFMSRSEAKRILSGLDKYEEIVFDFSGVRSVGQGFCDEIFRIFHNRYPKIELKTVHASENVSFMIRRSQA